MEKYENNANPLHFVLLGIAIFIALIFGINVIFINGAIILALSIMLTILYKPSFQASLFIVVPSIIVVYFLQETIIHNWKEGIEHVTSPFLNFSSAKHIIQNYPEFELALKELGRFMLYCLLSPRIWLHSLPVFVPLGLILANLYMYFKPKDLRDAYQKNTQNKLKNRKIKQNISKGFMAKVNRSAAFIDDSTLIGATYNNKKVVLKDEDLNKHVFVVGPTGSGKTITISNIAESFLARNLPVIFIDGKGDNDLARRMISCAEAHNSNAYHLSLDDGYSDHYDPFYTGGYTSVKDRIMTTLEWSEPFYENSANVFLQTAIKILMACKQDISIQSVIDYSDSAKLAQLLRQYEAELSNFDELSAELQSLDIEKKNLQGLMYGLQAFANSEVGKKLKHDDYSQTIRFKDVIDENALAYISLRPLEFPKHAKAFGKLVINDLKATLSEYMKTSPCKVLIIFDEFSSFSGEEVLNLINQGRSMGAHIVTGTQSIADLERAVPSNGAAFRDVMLENHKTWVIHSQSTVEGAEFFAKAIGTRTDYEPTVQIGEEGVTGMGSIREVQEFIIHPNDFKNLKMGEAYLNQNSSYQPTVFTKIRYSKIMSEG